MLPVAVNVCQLIDTSVQYRKLLHVLQQASSAQQPVQQASRQISWRRRGAMTQNHPHDRQGNATQLAAPTALEAVLTSSLAQFGVRYSMCSLRHSWMRPSPAAAPPPHPCFASIARATEPSSRSPDASGDERRRHQPQSAVPVNCAQWTVCAPTWLNPAAVLLDICPAHLRQDYVIVVVLHLHLLEVLHLLRRSTTTEPIASRQHRPTNSHSHAPQLSCPH